MSISRSSNPFFSQTASGPNFIGLNVLRAFSIIGLLLCLSGNIVTMTNDIKAIKSEHKDQPEDWDCDYVEYSTVPDQTGGPFWSILNRIFIVFECILLVLSEAVIPKRLFELFIPILGPAHGLGGLGVFQALIGTQVLSHYCDLFPQVTSWLLFIMGCLNIIAGVIFRSSAKQRRSLSSREESSLSTSQSRMAATSRSMLSEKYGPYAPSSMSNLSRQTSQHSESLLVPPAISGPRVAGLAFGKKNEKTTTGRGYTISNPKEQPQEYV